MSSFILSGTIGGKAIRGNVIRTQATEIGSQVTLAAGKAGNLTTRTSDTVGTLTLGASHGITTGAVIDLYWVGGQRQGVVVGTVAGVSVPFSLGVGAVLPADEFAVVACVQTVLDVDSLAANIAMAAASSTRRGGVQFQQADGTAIVSLPLAAGEGWFWANNIAATPFGADVGKIGVSNGDSANTAVVTVGIVVDNDT